MPDLFALASMEAETHIQHFFSVYENPLMFLVIHKLGLETPRISRSHPRGVVIILAIESPPRKSSLYFSPDIKY